MRLFIREHMLLIVVQILQFFLVLSIYWLDGYHRLMPALYSVFLGLLLLSGYLIFNYYSRRKFYARLSHKLNTLDQSLQKSDLTPVSEALDTLLKEQYQLYQKRIKTLEATQEEHLKFMNQWVHQMKTPLSVIELIAQNLDEPDSSNVREETERMKVGLNTILYMARLRTIEQDFHIKPVLLSKVISEVNKENKRFFIRNQVYPTMLESREGITVETDEKWLYFILSQLVNNAVKYSKDKSKKIIISLYEVAGEACIEVKDFGVGIPETDKRRVFEPFYTGENGRKFRESTGMGLYLTKEAIDQLGHRIELESSVNEGSTFRIVFSKTQNLTAL
ncbi:sensor histidine kinase [Metabacillus malikii]|uniref:histidine kinase n=1 Tax=Metabacillus malikii TaxID=1504265 RepID=A0ABT9ZHD8_9BACI|nr:sensor histidine kinase [Metabacillus malikii]MDQ0231691.1 signal transduction histidine kinase [Metabacillus malikii]